MKPRTLPVIRVTRHSSVRRFRRELHDRLKRGYALVAYGWEDRRLAAHWTFPRTLVEDVQEMLLSL